MGLLEVVADDLVGRAPAIVAPEQPAGIRHVQVGAAPLCQEVVGRVAHQDVREAVAGLAGELGPVVPDELAIDEGGEGGVDGALLVDERPHGTAVEPSTLDRRGLDHSAFAHRERIDAGSKERLDRRRSPDPRVVGAHRDELLEEERVPLRRVHHLVAPDLRPPPGRQAAEQAGRVGVGERLEPDDAALPTRGGPRRPPLEQVAARDADDQHGPGRAAPRRAR